jgi:uncharacterized membrane protein YfcA
MWLLGHILALLMGTTLGFLGAGGSIFTVPILVYILGINPILAMSYSLVVVGVAAFVGALQYWYKKQIHFTVAAIFALPSMASVFLTRRFIMPNMPEYIMSIEKDVFAMLLFALLMMITAILMLRPIKLSANAMHNVVSIRNLFKAVVGSAFVGFLSGLVGAGGGFMIIPALIVLFGLEMKKAIGTSLLIIAINALIAVSADLVVGVVLDWQLVGVFLVFTLLGVLLGIKLGHNFDSAKLKQIFGSLTLLLGLAIGAVEIYQLLNV